MKIAPGRKTCHQCGCILSASRERRLGVCPEHETRMDVIIANPITKFVLCCFGVWPISLILIFCTTVVIMDAADKL